MVYEIVATVLWSSLTLSILAGALGLFRHSWGWMLVAALLSMIFSVAAVLSIGPYSLLLTNLELAAAVGLRWSFHGIGWATVLLAAVSIWVVTVPLQLLVVRWPPLGLLAQLAILGAILATLIGPRATREASS